MAMNVLSRDDIRNIGEVVAQAVLEALWAHDQAKRQEKQETNAKYYRDFAENAVKEITKYTTDGSSKNDVE
jgi:hypothetical protein